MCSHNSTDLSQMDVVERLCIVCRHSPAQCDATVCERCIIMTTPIMVRASASNISTNSISTPISTSKSTSSDSRQSKSTSCSGRSMALCSLSKCHTIKSVLIPTIPAVVSTVLKIVLLTLALTTSQVKADGIFELRLDGFNNPLNRDATGNCCGSNSSTAFCMDRCATFFRVCLKNYQANVAHSSPTCLYGEKLTPVLELKSDFVVQFPFEFSWPGTFSLVIEAWHNASYQKSHSIVTPVNRHRAQTRSLIARSFESRPVRLRVDTQWTSKVQLLNQSTLRYSYRVLCKDHYYGETCTKLCTSRNTTLSHYGCDSNGNRVCHPGWSGDWCDKPICKSCTNGECIAPDQCRCRLGWTGPSCNQCMTYPNCANGFCNKPFECICKEGWGGLLCNKDLNYCTNHRPCKNSGICSNSGEGLFTCTCPPGFTGSRCEIRVDICEPNNSPCKNNGNCKAMGPSNYTCECPPGFGGRNCEKPISQCQNNPCANDGRCVDNENSNGFTCVCKLGFSGAKCEQRQRDCRPQNPCLNGGSCNNNGTSGGYTCKCQSGFAGDHCEQNVNDCESSPCLNSGTCVDEVNNFRCLCPAGFTGELCQINIDDCLLAPCANGGTCLDGANDFICLCPAGFTGKDCSIDINECASSPCMNNGECRDRINDYECHCGPTHYGPRCEFLNSTVVANMHQTSFASLVSDDPTTLVVYSFGALLCVVIAILALTACRRCQIRGRKISSKIAEEEARRQNEHNAVMSGLNNTANQRPLNGNFLAQCLNPTAANVIVNSLGEKSASLHQLAKHSGPYKLTNEYVYHEQQQQQHQQQQRNHYASTGQFYQSIEPVLNTKAATLGKSFKSQMSSKEMSLKVSLDDTQLYGMHQSPQQQQHTYEQLRKPSNLLTVNLSPNSSQQYTNSHYQQGSPIYESTMKQSNLQNNLQIAANLQSRMLPTHYMLENPYSHPVYADPKKLHATEV